MDNKQQMRWTKKGANLLLEVGFAISVCDVKERFAYQSPAQPTLPVIFLPVPLFQGAV
jgi:hypothetical protein